MKKLLATQVWESVWTSNCCSRQTPQSLLSYFAKHPGKVLYVEDKFCDPTFNRQAW